MRTEKLNPPGIVKSAKRLEEELAQKIKDREEKIVKTTLEHARLQGADLLRVKQHLGGRKFKPWLKANFRFCRQTAYNYMKVADNWSVICQGPLQMGSLEEVLQELSGEGKAKKKSKQGSARETDPTNSRPVEEPSSEGMPGEKIEAPSHSERVENQEPDQHQLTPEQEQEEKPKERSHEMNAAEEEDIPIKETPKKSRPNQPQQNGGSTADNAKNSFLIAIKHARVHDYLQGMMDDLLEEHRERGLYDFIYPEELWDLVKKEDLPARIILQLMQFAFDRLAMCKDSQRQERQQAK